MFIVEGLDYAGKTTVLETLQRLVRKQRWERWFGHKYISEIQKWGKLPVDFEYCQQYIIATHSAQLCDRFVLSELAYGEVFRGGAHPLFDSHARRRVQRELNVSGSVTLLVKADWETTLDRSKQRCLSEFDAAMKIRQTYDAGTVAFERALQDRALGRRGGTYLGAYDTSRRIMMEHAGKDESLGDIRARHDAACEDVLLWYMEQWKLHLIRSQAIQKACPHSWGYLWPKILFVGETVGQPSPRPFNGDNGASRTLTDLLDHADIGEKDVFFWNAYTFRGNALCSKDGVAALAPKMVVALGKEAHEHLEALDIAHVEFPHPQWIGRFHHSEIASYGQKLRALVAPALAAAAN